MYRLQDISTSDKNESNIFIFSDTINYIFSTFRLVNLINLGTPSIIQLSKHH